MKVKRIIPIIGILLFVSMFISCGKTGEAANSSSHSWSIASRSEAMFPKNISGLFNEKYGLTVGYSGEIHYTKDGGKTWSQGNNSSYCLFGLSIVNSKVAYACGNGRDVVKTTDSGAHWGAVASFGEYEPNHPRFLSFVNEDTGWIATPHKFDSKGKNVMLGSTKDGGITWTKIELPVDLEEIVAIYLRTPENGYILDNKCNLYKTNDGGRSFTKQPLNISDAYLSTKFEQHVVLRFSDENNAFIAYEDKNWKLHAARSSDGGKTWVSETVPDLSDGALYLSKDGKTMTFTRSDEFIKILEYK